MENKVPQFFVQSNPLTLQRHERLSLGPKIRVHLWLLAIQNLHKAWNARTSPNTNLTTQTSRPKRHNPMHQLDKHPQSAHSKAISPCDSCRSRKACIKQMETPPTNLINPKLHIRKPKLSQTNKI